MENECNVAEDESMLASIDESSTDYDYDDGSIRRNALKDIRDGSCIHPYINVTHTRLKMRDHIKQAQSEWK